MRTAIPLFVTAALVASLAACSAQPVEEATEGCDPVPSGVVSDAVGVTGDFGTKPKVTIDFPTAAEATERTVVIPGDGDVAVAGDTVNVQFSIFNGATGVELPGTEYGDDAAPQAFPIDDKLLLPGIVKTLECSRIGSRVVGVIPPVDGFGDAGSAQLGIAPGEDIIFVLDVLSIEEPLTPSAWTENVPEVTWAGDVPTVKLPDIDPPTELMLAVLEEGDGDVVPSGATVTIDYQGTSWDTGEIFDESFTKDPATFSTGGVIPGFGAALVGQKVGSTVIVVIPPEYAYGTDPAAHDLGGQTLVFLIQIQAIAG